MKGFGGGGAEEAKSKKSSDHGDIYNKMKGAFAMNISDEQ